ncbi:hypothetical protein MMAG44476_19924 [Mycolicibacterium mageritense DSM 44476 = CIP 104973]|uniref:Membrane protein n=1 Tax=Mycolicibacterium mageritense TaxID=53462 RepID=A0ABM7HJU7_MYCME|nr:hypothetical protein [Mycolicibacterium mageritense]MCC9182284.1 hypothetical protein [Mycolicibacterium mageritense]BBX30757.1 membrane protein [Mycolicibacterium mageritense]CDO24052.1 membrane protein [Mycolicibacterium mageritense DSM 44476 = CIP 104973]
MPSRKPSSSVLDSGDDGGDDMSSSDALALAEQAEAEALEAEAVAAAARARARALRLRRQAEEKARAGTVAADAPPEAVDDTDHGADAAADDAAQVVPDEPAGDEATVAEPRRRLNLPSGNWWKVVAAGVAVMLTVALLAAAGYMIWHHRDAQAEQRRAAEFAAAARQGVVTLMSLDFNHAKEDVQRIIDSSTGQFKTDFEATAEDFAKVAESSKVSTDVTVNAAAVSSMSDDSAVVLVAATSHVTNAAGAKQDPRNWRLSVTVARDGDQIKLSKVEFVP